MRSERYFRARRYHSPISALRLSLFLKQRRVVLQNRDYKKTMQSRLELAQVALERLTDLLSYSILKVVMTSTERFTFFSVEICYPTKLDKLLHKTTFK